jgi:hypothetical protein
MKSEKDLIDEELVRNNFGCNICKLENNKCINRNLGKIDKTELICINIKENNHETYFKHSC